MSGVEYAGLTDLVRSLHELGGEVERGVKDELRRVGEVVRADADQRFAKYSEKTAAGFRVRVRAAGLVQVEQSLRKTTGRRPDFGARQMTKALLPAADENLERAAEGIDERIGLVLRLHGF